MPLFEDSAEDEIRRLRRIIAKLEETKGARVVTVEWVRKEGYGYLFYIAAPTTASEKEFGLALADRIERSFKVIGLDAKRDFAREVNEPPSDREIAVQNSLTVSQAAATTQPENAGCYIRESAFGRWILVNTEIDALAWSGSRWVAHKNGLPASGVQVANFENALEALRYAQDAGLTPVLSLISTDAKSITCLICGMTSHNENDVRERYCGNCHVSLEGSGAGQ